LLLQGLFHSGLASAASDAALEACFWSGAGLCMFPVLALCATDLAAVADPRGEAEDDEDEEEEEEEEEDATSFSFSFPA